jgi:5'-nucleotidase
MRARLSHTPAKLLFLFLVLSSACFAEDRIRIISFSDFHGALQEKMEYEGQEPVGMWGPAEFAEALTYLKRDWNGGSVIVTNGDDYQGSLVSNLFEGKPVVDFYDHVGVSLSTLGNHDFDYGPLGVGVTVRKGEDEDRLGALKERMKQAHHDFIVANLRNPRGGLLQLPKLREDKIVTIGHTPVGFLGLITPRTPNLTISRNVQGIRFDPMRETTLRLVPEMRKAGARILVVMAHAGAACPGPTVESCPPLEEIIQYANSLPPKYVDLIIAAHSHSFLNLVVNGIPVVQSGSYGRGVAVSDFLVLEDQSFRLSTKVFRISEMKSLISDHRDDSVLALLKPYYDKVKEVTEEVVGELATPLTRQGEGATLMGAFITDRLKESIPGADVALMNKGGMRADLPQGKITYGQVYDVLPFDNNVATVSLKGRELKELVRLATSGAHGLSQFSGLQITLDLKRDLEKNPDQRNRVVDIRLADGSPLEDSKTYLVVTNDFLLEGGDELGDFFEGIPSSQKEILAFPLRDYIAKWFRAKRGSGPIRYELKEIRIKLL